MKNERKRAAEHADAARSIYLADVVSLPHDARMLQIVVRREAFGDAQPGLDFLLRKRAGIVSVEHPKDRRDRVLGE